MPITSYVLSLNKIKKRVNSKLVSIKFLSENKSLNLNRCKISLVMLFKDGPRNFEQLSDDKDNTSVSNPSSNFVAKLEKYFLQGFLLFFQK